MDGAVHHEGALLREPFGGDAIIWANYGLGITMFLVLAFDVHPLRLDRVLLALGGCLWTGAAGLRAIVRYK